MADAIPLVVIAAACFGIAGGLPLLQIAANRLVVGTPVSAVAALGSRGWLVVGLCLLGGLLQGAGRSRVVAFAALAAFSAALMLLAAGLGAAAADLVAGQPPAARARLASGSWVGLLLLSGLVAAAAARVRMPGSGWLTLAALMAGFVLLYASGAFDGLSLAMEYRARAGSVRAAVIQHLILSATAVALSALGCVLLYAWRPGRGAVEIAVNGLQVVPAVALLGGLVALTSGLLTAFPAMRSAGLSALGPGPAILAVAAYLLLPLWRGLEGALRAPDPATIDAARAIGLTSHQTLRDVRLPLGAPILVGALRVASVQSIGLATLGALVGAGGLGGIVFDGMSQFAPDLILLGALPVIGISLIVERALSLLENRVRQRWHG
ncbi:ABC transporter permease [Methylobacterium haplocladii]|uniref:ABC transporter permease n=1 Tax=Methylobacterium haplocladii TaxID=1176176 RepID=UPI001EDF4036|nr:ABC transporter permease subunit [Methylobacterium haplocladii]